MYINQIGHFYFGKNRTFLNWLDTRMILFDFERLIDIFRVQLKSQEIKDERI